MNGKFLLTLIFVIALHGVVLAQIVPGKTETPKQEAKRVKKQQYNFKEFTKETGKFVTLPLRWKTEDWFKLGFLGAGTYLFMQADEPLRSFLGPDNQRKYYYSVPIVAGRVYGEWYTTATIFVGVEAYQFATRNSKKESKKIGLELFQSALYSEAITSILKVTVGRARPYVDTGNFVFHPLTLKSSFNSYPSGHTTLAFALSTVLSRNVNSPVLKVLCYVPAVMTLSSRIYQDQHWDSDILTGAAIGFFTATWVVNLHEIKKPVAPEKEFSPLPAEPNKPTTPAVPVLPERKTHFGILAGVNSCQMQGPNVLVKAVRGGAIAGVFAKIGFSNYLALQPELYYSMKGGNLIYNNSYVRGNAIFNANYIDLPVLGVINLTKNTNVQGGFYVSKLVNSKTTIGPDSTSVDFSKNLSAMHLTSFDYGLVLGLGVNMKSFNYGIRYNYGLNTIGKNENFNGQTHRFPDGSLSLVQAFISYNIK